MKIAMITDPNARTVYVEYVTDGFGRRTVLVVETHLQLDEAELDFEPDKVRAICDNLDKHRASLPYINAIRLIRVI